MRAIILHIFRFVNHNVRLQTQIRGWDYCPMLDSALIFQMTRTMIIELVC